MNDLAQEFTEIVRTPKGSGIYAFTPAICVLESGRYVFSGDLGGSDVPSLPEYASITPAPDSGSVRFGHIYTSDDRGETWQRRAVRNFTHARPFAHGNTVYVLGHSGDLVIYRSNDGGETWDDGSYLTQGELWHQSACAYWIEDGYITLVMEQKIIHADEYVDFWPVAYLAPVVMRAKLTDDLRLRSSWSFSNRVRFVDLVSEDTLAYHGIPFYNTFLHRERYPDGQYLTHPVGWLESNVVRITDPNHYWYDPSGRTYHIFMRANTAGTGYCCLMRAVIGEDGSITVEPQKNPSGRDVLFLPMPGGQNRFHLLWDAQTRLYWLLSVQSVDSMTHIALMGEERYHIPCDERDRLQLSFSRNCVDWCFAGLVAHGCSPKQSRHYASMAIDGEDLIVVSRSGDEDTESAHNTNLATFHRIKNFRDLVY